MANVVNFFRVTTSGGYALHLRVNDVKRFYEWADDNETVWTEIITYDGGALRCCEGVDEVARLIVKCQTQ